MLFPYLQGVLMATAIKRWRPQVVAVILFVLTMLCSTPVGHAQWKLLHRSQCPPPCDPCAPPPELTFSAGAPRENLQVHVVGSKLGSLDIYFKATEEFQNFQRVALPEASNLHLNNSLILAPANPAGTFAVRYGPHQDTLMVYAWTKNAVKLSQGGSYQFECGYPVCPYWVTSRILRVQYGPDGAKTAILILARDADTWVPPQTFP